MGEKWALGGLYVPYLAVGKVLLLFSLSLLYLFPQLCGVNIFLLPFSGVWDDLSLGKECFGVNAKCAAVFMGTDMFGRIQDRLTPV